MESLNCQIISINETWHKNKNDSIDIEGYTWIGHQRKTLNKRRKSGSGGVGFLVANDLYSDYNIKVEDDNYDGILCISVTSKHSDYSFIYATAYLPPENSMYGRDSASFFAYMSGLVYRFVDHDAFYVSGDLNARIGDLCDSIDEVDPVPLRVPIDYTVNGHGKALIDFCKDNKMCVINGRISPLSDNFTSISSKGMAVVDYFLSSHDCIQSINHFKVLTMSDAIQNIGPEGVSRSPTSISDHSLLIMYIATRDTTFPGGSGHGHGPRVPPGSNTNSNSTENANLPPRFRIQEVPDDFLQSDESRAKLISLIDEIENSRNTQVEINGIYSKLKNMYIDEMTTHFRTVNTTPMAKKKYRFTCKEWWDDELTALWKDLHEAEKIFIKAKKQQKQIKKFHILFKSKQDIFDKHCKRKKRTYQRNQCDKLEEVNTSNPTEFWNCIKNLGPKKHKDIPWECYDSDGNVITDRDRVLDKWREDFYSLYCNDSVPSDEQTMFKEHIISDNASAELQFINSDQSPLNVPFTFEEVKTSIDKSKKTKAAGMDGIVYDVLKNEPSAMLLTTLFNLCFSSHKVPEVWLEAIIHPIPKSSTNDPRVPLNYRGISLLSVISKLYTTTLNSRLSAFCEANNLLVNEQNGFRPDRSCLDHIFVLNDVLRVRKKLNSQTFLAFVDFKKAFDYVDRDFLMYKLRQAGVDGNFYHAIQALYSGARSSVRLNNTMTDTFEVKSGVRQGDPLSPTLFSLFLNDLAEEINDSDSGVLIGGICLAILLYADDICLLAPSEEKLQHMLNILDRWCRKWGMVINTSKTQIMHIRNPQRPRSNFKFKCCDTELNYTDSYKYLGYFVHEHLNNEHNVSVLTSAASRSFGRIHSSFKKLKNMGINTFETLCESYVYPIMNYASGAWGFDYFQKPQVLQNRISRFYLGIHRFAPVASTRIEMDWIECKELRWLEMLRLFNRINCMDDNRLPKIIYKWDLSLGLDTWVSEVKHIAATIGMSTHPTDNEVFDLQHAKAKLLEKNRISWSLEADRKPKLRTFNIIHDFSRQKTLVKANLSRFQRSLLAQMKFGILPLKLETDRYQGIPENQRLCQICTLGAVESEFHFIFHCPTLGRVRDNFLPKFNIDFSANTEASSLHSMLSTDHIQITARYIEALYKERQNTIYE